MSQICGPEAVLAGELDLPYAPVGFPVNHATGVAQPESKESLDRLLKLSTEVQSWLVLGTVQMLEEKDLTFDHGYLYRVDGAVG